MSYLQNYDAWKIEAVRQLEIMRGPVHLSDLVTENELFNMWLMGDRCQDAKFELSDRLDVLHASLN